MVAALSLAAAAPADVSAAVDRPPNIVLVYADDLGYGDPACYNPRRGKIPTPRLDQMAREGMRFTDAHSSSSVCSPSRYTLLTGRFHWRTRLPSGIVQVWEPPLIAEHRWTLASMLRQKGYQTACIGKWHLGWNWPIQPDQRSHFRPARGHQKDARANDRDRSAWREVFSKPIAGGPTQRGFDSYFGVDLPNWPPYCFIENDRTLGIPTELLPERLLRKNQASIQGPALSGWSLEPVLPALTDRAAQYIAAAAKRPEPYFLYLPLTSPHTPLAVNRPWLGKSGLGSYADFVMETDAALGRVMDAIDASGEKDQTLVLFTSDNGCAPYIGVRELETQGHFPSGPLRGYKSDVWEGGHRVPFLVRWPNVVAGGATCERLVHQADVMATCAELVGVELPPNAGEDSISFLPVLRGSDRPTRDESVNQSIHGLLALRRGPWKLIFGPGSGGWSKGDDAPLGQLYHLEQDLGETKNLYAERPRVVAGLMGRMEEIVRLGRSTPGPPQENDQPVLWRKFLRSGSADD